MRVLLTISMLLCLTSKEQKGEICYAKESLLIPIPPDNLEEYKEKEIGNDIRLYFRPTRIIRRSVVKMGERS